MFSYVYRERGNLTDERTNESGYNVFDAEAIERMKLIKQMNREQNYSINKSNTILILEVRRIRQLRKRGRMNY